MPAALSPAAYQDSRLSLEFRLYVWSLLLDPLLFFLLSDEVQVGIGLTLARLVQAAFLVVFVLRLAVTNNRWILPNPGFYLYRLFTIYFVLLIASSFAGFLLYDSYALHNVPPRDGSPVSAQVLRGAYSRPFVEIVILFYYFGYFVLLPKYLITTKQQFAYLFKWLVRIFYLMLAVGFADLFLQLAGLGYIPKFMVGTEFGHVGFRFHGLVGEPRDAFPYLLFGLAVMYLRAALYPGAAIARGLLPVVVLAMVLTQSGSGAMGLALGACAVLIYFCMQSVRRLITGIVLIAAVLVCTAVLVSMSPRLLDYVEMFSQLWGMLNAGDTLPYLAVVQSSDFLPFWQMWVYLRQFDLGPVLFGSGIGSTSITNNNLSAAFIEDSTSDLMNAKSQITRVVFETGLVGFLIYVAIFIRPMRELLKRLPRNGTTNALFIVFLLLLGASLSHRTTTIFIFVGIVLAVVTHWPGRASPARTNLEPPIASSGRHQPA